MLVKENSEMTAGSLTHGFPEDYFVIKSVSNDLLWDVSTSSVADGTEVILYKEKESSLVAKFRMPESDNQVFFVDNTGALCSLSSGHALDIEGDKVVIRHRRPFTDPFPNAYSHHLPFFSYSPSTGQITIQPSSDLSYPTSPKPGQDWARSTYVLTAIPSRRPRTIVDDASEAIISAVTTPFAFLTGTTQEPKSRPEDIFNGDIDLAEDEIIETDRTEEGELDDSPAPARKLRMVPLTEDDIKASSEAARKRGRWAVIPLRSSRATTGRST